MKKIIIATIFTASTMLASTVFPGYFEVETPEGNKFEMKLKGDRSFNWFETKQGERLKFLPKSDKRSAGYYHMEVRSNGVKVLDKSIDQVRMPRNQMQIKQLDRELNKVWEIKKSSNKRSLSTPLNKSKQFKPRFELQNNNHKH